MQYEDMSTFKILQVEYANVLAIGWLNNNLNHKKEEPSKIRVKKLKNIITKSRNNDSFNYSMSYRRGVPFHCPFCKEPITYNSNITLSPHYECGHATMVIPSIENNVYFYFPDLLPHYMEKHLYAPPEIFLQSLDKISLSREIVILDEMEIIRREITQS